MEISEKYTALSNDWLIKNNLSNFITLTVFDDPSLKIKDDKYLGKVSVPRKPWDSLIEFDIVVTINEEYFEQLETMFGIEERDIALERLLEQIGFDTEKDSVVINKPNVIEHRGILEKYGVARIVDAHNAAVLGVHERIQESKD